jgi:hypothetical protein
LTKIESAEREWRAVGISERSNGGFDGGGDSEEIDCDSNLNNKHCVKHHAPTFFSRTTLSAAVLFNPSNISGHQPFPSPTWL